MVQVHKGPHQYEFLQYVIRPQHLSACYVQPTGFAPVAERNRVPTMFNTMSLYLHAYKLLKQLKKHFSGHDTGPEYTPKCIHPLLSLFVVTVPLENTTVTHSAKSYGIPGMSRVDARAPIKRVYHVFRITLSIP